MKSYIAQQFWIYNTGSISNMSPNVEGPCIVIPKELAK